MGEKNIAIESAFTAKSINLSRLQGIALVSYIMNKKEQSTSLVLNIGENNDQHNINH